jgi:hypothetical protein
MENGPIDFAKIKTRRFAGGMLRRPTPVLRRFAKRRGNQRVFVVANMAEDGLDDVVGNGRRI